MRRNAPGRPETWRVRFRHEGHNRAVAFTTEKAAQAWQAVLDGLGPEKALALLAPETDTGRTVAQQVTHHIDHLTGVTDGTRSRYRDIAAQWITPTLGEIPLEHLTRDRVAEWINSQGSAPKSLMNRHSLLSAALASAVDAGLIPSNPARGVRLPRIDRVEEAVFLTRGEFARLLELIREPYRPLVLLLGGTGMRWGEATALTIGDLDRESRTARIRQAWKQGPGGGVLGPPKSRRSRRTVAVPEAVFDALAPGMEGRAPHELAVLNPRGRPVRSGSFHEDVWQPATRILKDETGRKPRIHDLRHSYASWMLAAGVPITVVQRQLGHESITTTVDTYGHLARADYEPLVAQAEQMLIGS